MLVCLLKLFNGQSYYWRVKIVNVQAAVPEANNWDVSSSFKNVVIIVIAITPSLLCKSLIYLETVLIEIYARNGDILSRPSRN